VRFNIFDRKPEEPRVVALRQMIAGFRELSTAMENDLNRNKKEGNELCDECCADLVIKVMDASAKLTAIFATEARVPKSMTTALMLKNLSQMFGERPQPSVRSFFVPVDGSQLM
jgi:hypothetical protein